MAKLSYNNFLYVKFSILPYYLYFSQKNEKGIYPSKGISWLYLKGT